MQTVTFSGLHCEACSKLIIKKLNKIEGVIKVTPLDEQGMFEIETNTPVSSDQINQQFAETDYHLEALR